MRTCPALNARKDTIKGEAVSETAETTRRRKQLTTAPVEAGAVAGPEFIRMADGRKLFGLSRTYLYNLLAAGLIKGVNLRKPGCKTGVRLLSVQSIRDYLASQMQAS